MNLLIKSEPIPLVIDSNNVVRVQGTRIPLDTIVGHFNRGESAEAIVEQFPVLDLADVYAVISYYLRHQVEVEAYLEEREVEAAKIREEIEKRFPSHGLREKLLALRQAKKELGNDG